MAFRFVHAADLHIDSPLKGLAARDEAVAGQFMAASRRAFRELIARTIRERAAFLIIAGDVFDGDWRDYATGLFFTREIARLGREGIPTFAVRGNHDAECQITRRLDWPPGMHMLSARKAETCELPDLRVAVHGRSFASAAETESLVRGYPTPRSGWLNIGVLHTSLDGREGHACYAPTSVAELAACGYDYWALGHVHAFEEVARDPWIIYPGNLQGRHIRETGPKGAVLVSVDDDLRVAGVERLILDEARWSAASVDLSSSTDRDAALELVQRKLVEAVGAADGRPVALRVTLAGTTSLHHALAADPAELTAAIENVALQVSDSAWIERVVLETSAPALPPSATNGLADAVALLDEIVGEPGLLDDRLAEGLKPLLGKLPRTIAAELACDHTLIAGARDLVLGRLTQHED